MSGKSPVSARRTTQNPALLARAKTFARNVMELANRWTRKPARRQKSPANDATGPRSAEHGATTEIGSRAWIIFEEISISIDTSEAPRCRLAPFWGVHARSWRP